MNGSLPEGVRVRTAPTRDDVVRLRKAYLRRNAPQVRIMRLSSALLAVLAVGFAAISLRLHRDAVAWLVTGLCAVFAVASRMLAAHATAPIDAHFARPTTTVFTGDALWIDDEDDVWTIPYAEVTRLDRRHGVNEVRDSAGGVTLLPLGAIPDAEVHRFTR